MALASGPSGKPLPLHEAAGAFHSGSGHAKSTLVHHSMEPARHQGVSLRSYPEHAASQALNASHRPAFPSDERTRADAQNRGASSPGAIDDAVFEQLSLEELRQVLSRRDDTVAELRGQIAELEREPEEFQRRLLELEKVFENISPADVLKLQSPVLRGICKVIRESHAQNHKESEAHADTHVELKADGDHFALGRGCMHIDRLQMAREKEVRIEVAGGDVMHPSDKLLQYAGHLGHPHGAAGAVLVGPAGGALGRQPLAHPRSGGFWLKAAGIEKDQTGGVRDEAQAVDLTGMHSLRRAAAWEAVYGPGTAASMPKHHGHGYSIMGAA